MATMHDNEVRILVYDEAGNAVNLYSTDRKSSKWAVEFGTPVVTKGQEASGAPKPKWDKNPRKDAPKNELNFVFEAGRKRTKNVATAYLNYGFATKVTLKDGDWPSMDNIDFEKSAVVSANLDVGGDLQVPEEMNFFYPVKITTNTGFVMNLVLGQTGTGKGWVQNLVSIGKAGKAAYKFGENVYKENPLGALWQVYKFQKALGSLINAKNTWFVTAMGNTEYPSVTVPEQTVNKAKYVGIACVGPTYQDLSTKATEPYKIGAPDGNKQMGYFFVKNGDKPNNFTFKLKIFDKVKI